MAGPIPTRLALIGASCVAAWLATGPAHAQPSRPQPPPARVERFDPDTSICQPEELESAHRRQLLPWADQSEAVLSRLRQVQADMLRASLRRCQERGLLTPEQVRGVEERLALPPAVDPLPSGQRP